MALTDNLQLFAEFENNGNDATANANNLTNNGGATFTTGKVGQATQLASASSQFWSIADNPSLSVGGTNFSMWCWVYLNSDATFNFISKNDVSVNREYVLGYSTALNRFQFITWSAASGVGQKTVTSNNFGAVALFTWYFLAAVYDGVGNYLYVNAIPNSTASTTSGWDGAASFLIGSQNGTQNFMNGLIDQVSFLKRALSFEEVVMGYNNGNGLSYAEMQTLSSGVFLPGGVI